MAEYSFIRQRFTEYLLCAEPRADNTDVNKTGKVSTLKLTSSMGELIYTNKKMEQDSIRW